MQVNLKKKERRDRECADSTVVLIINICKVYIKIWIFIEIGYWICSESHHIPKFMAYSWVHSLIKRWNLKTLRYTVSPLSRILIFTNVDINLFILSLSNWVRGFWPFRKYWLSFATDVVHLQTTSILFLSLLKMLYIFWLFIMSGSCHFRIFLCCYALIPLCAFSLF